MQSKKRSLIEVSINRAIAYVTGVLGQMTIYRILDIDVEIKNNLIIGVFFMVVSFVRCYIVRRVFSKND